MGWLTNMTKEIFDAEVNYGKHDITLVTKSAKVFLSSAHPNAAYISVRKVLFHCEDEMVQGELSLTAVLSKKDVTHENARRTLCNKYCDCCGTRFRTILPLTRLDHSPLNTPVAVPLCDSLD